MEELNICTLFIQTSLPPNHPTSLKVKNVHNFAIFQWICMKLCMETLNERLIVLANLQGQRSFGHSDLMELVIFNPPSVADPDTVQIFALPFDVVTKAFLSFFVLFNLRLSHPVIFRFFFCHHITQTFHSNQLDNISVRLLNSVVFCYGCPKA